MKKRSDGQLIFSPTDLIQYLASPFASWMERYYLEHPNAVKPDDPSEDERLVARTGDDHERAVLDKLKAGTPGLMEIPKHDFPEALTKTAESIKARAPIIYQGALQHGRFAGYTDFLRLDGTGSYQVWDTKLAQSPKPYYAIQLCCYSEMLAPLLGGRMPARFGVILGNKEEVEFRVEDFLHYYLRVKAGFLAMQDGFSGDRKDCPEPQPRAEHRRWTSHAEAFFAETDHLVQVAGISIGQIKKLRNAGIHTVAELAAASGRQVPKLAGDSLEKLAAQARLQCGTRADRLQQPKAAPRFEVLPSTGPNGEPLGLATLPPANPADVFFDMEGYPLVAGGLEYLFGAGTWDEAKRTWAFHDWWAHDREAEKLAFEEFVDWVYKRWKENPALHVYHYAAYEASAVRRLSSRHQTRQDEVDQLLRHGVFIDLYQVVRHGLRIGEDSYSIKKVERLYRLGRTTEVATAVDSIVQYARWISSNEPKAWAESRILKGIRDYNEDDCKSTAELLLWLRDLALKNKITPFQKAASTAPTEPPELPPEALARLETGSQLRRQTDDLAAVLADLIDFHRREERPVWWRLFDRAEATPEELRDDPGCIEGIQAVGQPEQDKQSLIQAYSFDPAQECKLAAGEDTEVMFSFDLKTQFKLVALDASAGTLALRIGARTLGSRFGGAFPPQGSLLPHEHVPARSIQSALAEIAAQHVTGKLHAPIAALLQRRAPAQPLQVAGETSVQAASRVCASMNGACLVVQGPPGTGKSYTASRAIVSLLAAGRKVGVASNSHKAVVNLLIACGQAAREAGREFSGIKVGGEQTGPLFAENPQLRYVGSSEAASAAYSGGIVGGTAWLFTRPEWEGKLDFLFIDEAGQVSLANAVAMARCASNLVLLGDQMQLEHPVQGSHPGDAALSVLQYALKDTQASRPDAPVFHAVVPADYGLFLGESHRMHPSVCRFISESMYEGRLEALGTCARQKIAVPARATGRITVESGVVFSGIVHDGNIQQSDEEVRRVAEIFHELAGRPYTDKDGQERTLQLEDFLFVAPYNAQVRALQAALPPHARVGSVDKFQGQEAPVCILSLCSSYGEYGSRGLGFILDRNRVNVALSRAQCLAVVVADPRIAQTPAASLDHMRLLNLFCKLSA